jgi:hypothetical protein
MGDEDCTYVEKSSHAEATGKAIAIEPELLRDDHRGEARRTTP